MHIRNVGSCVWLSRPVNKHSRIATVIESAQSSGKIRMDNFKVGQQVEVKLSGGRLVDSEIKTIIETTEGKRLQVSFFWRRDSPDLFEYNGLELVVLSKPFKTKKLAEKARLQ